MFFKFLILSFIANSLMVVHSFPDENRLPQKLIQESAKAFINIRNQVSELTSEIKEDVASEIPKIILNKKESIQKIFQKLSSISEYVADETAQFLEKASGLIGEKKEIKNLLISNPTESYKNSRIDTSLPKSEPNQNKLFLLMSTPKKNHDENNSHETESEDLVSDNDYMNDGNNDDYENEETNDNINFSTDIINCADGNDQQNLKSTNCDYSRKVRKLLGHDGSSDNIKLETPDTSDISEVRPKVDYYSDFQKTVLPKKLSIFPTNNLVRVPLYHIKNSGFFNLPNN